MKVILYADFTDGYLGTMLLNALQTLKWEFEKVDILDSKTGFRFIDSFFWHFLSKRSPRINKVKRSILRKAEYFKPDMILFSGIPKFDRDFIDNLNSHGIKTCIYLTDDPWNPNHFSKLFFKNASAYTHIFSTKTALLEPLKQIGCRNVTFIPFGFAPEQHYPELSDNNEMRKKYECDVAYIGGGDQDRVEDFKYLLNDSSLKLKLYGGAWDKYPETKPFFQWRVNSNEYRFAVKYAKILILNGRRANRDQHAMRSFEIPAMHACCLTEDSTEHRLFFGADGKNVLYYSTPEELYEKVKFLLEHPEQRKKLADNVFTHIHQAGFTYSDRLKQMAEIIYE